MTEVDRQLQPKWPFIMLNDYYIAKPETFNTIQIITKKGLDQGKFKSNLNIIDIDCFRFPVLDVIDFGRALWPFWFLSRLRPHRVGYVYGTPERISFEEARKSICDLIISKRWYGQGDESREQFEERCYGYDNMKEFMESISFYGKWVF